MSKSLTANATFNVAYKVLNVIFPLFTSMYISRVLMPSGVGEVAYALSVAQYFVTFAALGLPSYGVREVSRARTEGTLDKVFSELLLVNAVASVVSAVAYIALVLFAYGSSGDLALHMVFVVMVVLNLFNIDWFYQGIEEYGYIAVRRIAVKAASLALMLVLVRDSGDTLVYACLLCMGTVGNYLLNVFRLRRFAHFTLKGIRPKRHVKPALYLLTVAVAADLYGRLNTTLLGIFSLDEQVGYYSNGQSCLNVCLQLLLAVTGVFLPRLSLLYKEDKSAFDDLVSKGLRILLYFGLPMVTFILFDAEDVVSILFGDAFAPAGEVVKLLSPLLVIKGVGDLMCFQVLLAANKERYFLPSRFAGAAVNLAFGIPLIMRLGSCGGAVASVLSEAAVNAPLFVVALKQVNVRVGGKFLGSTALSLAVMAGVLALVLLFGPGGLLGLAAEFVLSSFAYVVVSLSTRNEICLFVLRKLARR